MNRHLYQSYLNLNESLKNELHTRLKDSPVALSLLSFISDAKNSEFRNLEVVKYIYKKELTDTNYSTLENRYFKVRKKVLDEINKIDKGSPDELPQEEQKFLNCKKLVFGNQKEAAYQLLLDLEEECWQKNIFELLPGIIDQIIFINQSFNRLEKDDAIYKRYREAISLQNDLWTMIMLTRKAYELNFRSGVESAYSEFEALKEIADRNKAYPRFYLCYHNTKLYYTLSSKDFDKVIDVISYHHNEFSKLNEKYPFIPHVSYRANYTQYQNFHFKQISVFYLFNKFDFANTYKVMSELFQMVTNEKSIYSIFNSESIYFNFFQSQISTGRFTEAEKTVELYMSFLRKNKQTEKLQQAYVMQIIAKTEALLVEENDYVFFEDKLDTYIRYIRKNSSIQIPVGEAAVLKLKLYLLNKNYARANDLFKKAEVKEYLQSLSIYETSKSAMNALQISFPKADVARKLIAELNNHTDVKRPEGIILLNWFVRYFEKSA